MKTEKYLTIFMALISSLGFIVCLILPFQHQYELTHRIYYSLIEMGYGFAYGAAVVTWYKGYQQIRDLESAMKKYKEEKGNLKP